MLQMIKLNAFTVHLILLVQSALCIPQKVQGKVIAKQLSPRPIVLHLNIMQINANKAAS